MKYTRSNPFYVTPTDKRSNSLLNLFLPFLLCTLRKCPDIDAYVTFNYESNASYYCDFFSFYYIKFKEFLNGERKTHKNT